MIWHSGRMEMQTADVEEAGAASARIVVVDDDPGIRETITEFLRPPRDDTPAAAAAAVTPPPVAANSSRQRERMSSCLSITREAKASLLDSMVMPPLRVVTPVA